MSSARANASARNRRAGGNEMQPQQMNGRPGQQQMQQPMMPPKLSISDAIALITLRLGRVEQIIQEIPMDRQTGPDVDGDNVKIVDNEVFESVLKRLDVLDKGYKDIVSKMNKPQPNTNTSSTISTEVTQAIEQMKSEMEQIKNMQQSVSNTQVNKTESHDISETNETIEVLKAEMNQVKEHLLNLQSFSMQTNQRLVEVLLNNVVNDDDELVANDINAEITNNETVHELAIDTDTDNETNDRSNVVVTETLLL